MYTSFLPGPALRELVRNYTIIDFQFGDNVSVPFKQRSPKPEQKIVFYIKDLPGIYCKETGTTKTPPPIAIFSHQLEKKTIQLPAQFSAFIIFLQPGALYRWTRLPMMELLDQVWDAELFFGTEVREVSDQLASASGYSSMIAIAERFMLSRCKKPGGNSAINTIAFHLLKEPASFTLDTLSQQACLSTKQFYRKFTEQIGISPKLFSRLSRFNQAYKYKIAQPSLSWSSIAQELSYTDYHHMEKEFKEFTGLTPQEWTKVHLSAPERILRLR